MPFGLKNAGAMYQRLVDKLIEPLIGCTMEMYMDDIIVKSMLDTEHDQICGRRSIFFDRIV